MTIYTMIFLTVITLVMITLVMITLVMIYTVIILRMITLRMIYTVKNLITRSETLTVTVTQPCDTVLTVCDH